MGMGVIILGRFDLTAQKKNSLSAHRLRFHALKSREAEDLPIKELTKTLMDTFGFL